MRPPTSISLPPSLRQRLDALTPRERVFVGTGVLAVFAFLIYFLVAGEESGESEPIEMLPVAAPATPPPVPMLPVTPIVTAPPPPPPAGQIAGGIEGLTLRGVMGGGPSGGAAIIAFPDGRQRVVRIGREFLPGMILKEVALRHVIASGGAGDIRLDLNRPGGVAVPAATGGSTPATAPASAAPIPASQQREPNQFQQGLQAMKRDGRVAGYSLKPGASIPVLEQAGLRPGDVVLGVNGSVLDEERLMELPWQIANSESTEFEFVRNGKKMKAAVARPK
jgi:general secretion pathway protein C